MDLDFGDTPDDLRKAWAAETDVSAPEQANAAERLNRLAIAEYNRLRSARRPR
jgi:hypothetical protein